MFIYLFIYIYIYYNISYACVHAILRKSVVCVLKAPFALVLQAFKKEKFPTKFITAAEQYNVEWDRGVKLQFIHET